MLAVEAPITVDQLARRIMPAWGLSMKTNRVTRHLYEALKALHEAGRGHTDQDVIWLPNQSPDTYTGYRVPATEGDRPRELEDIPLIEMANAVESILRQHISLPKEDLIKATVHVFGVARVTGRAQEIVGQGIERLQRRGGCEVHDGVVTLTR